jgi:hypothetical protein
MESDCEDSSSLKMNSSSNDDILKMLSLISSQMTSNYQHLQERLDQTDLRLSTELQQVHQVNQDFRQNVSAEMEALRNLITQNTSSSSLPSRDVITPVSGPSPVLSSSTSPPVPTPLFTGASTSSENFQIHMMKLLNETFSKLSTALADNKSMDVKTDWPKFSGDSKKFRAWHLAIMAQLSLFPWQELYDPVSNDIVQTTSNTTLNGKLYAKLLVSLEGQALQSIVSRKHLRVNGVLLLRELVQTYKPKNVPEVIAAKTGEFWSHTKRLPTETVDTYYNRFHDLLDELNKADEPISTKSAIRHFIFTLGPEFETIQNNFRIGNLPNEWKTQDWPSLLVLCHDYFHSIKPQSILQTTSSYEHEGLSQSE